MGFKESGVPAQCARCESFRGEGRDFEILLPGLTALSSGYASVRSDDGICARHDRFVAAKSCCADFSPLTAGKPRYTK